MRKLRGFDDQPREAWHNSCQESLIALQQCFYMVQVALERVLLFFLSPRLLRKNVTDIRLSARALTG
jgi:hypothetical protein